MKKILLTLVGALLAIIPLTSCDNEASITYVDASGKEQTIKVSATEDKETIESVMEYAQDAEYDDITSFTLKEKCSLSATLAKDVNDVLELSSKDKIVGSASMTLQVSEKDGLDLSLTGDLSLGKENSAKLYADVLYNDKLDSVLTSSESVYVKAGYDMKTISNSSKGEVQQAYSPATILDKVKDELEEFIPTDIPSLGDDSMDEIDDLDEFYAKFKNSKIIISEVKDGVIYLQFNLALKDLIAYADPDSEELKPFLSLNSSFILTYGIEASTGRFRELSFEFDDVKLINFILSSYLGIDLPITNLAESFHVETKLSIEYNKAKIRTLTPTEKAKYPLAEI